MILIWIVQAYEQAIGYAGEEQGICEEEYGHVLEEESVVYEKQVIACGQLGFL